MTSLPSNFYQLGKEKTKSTKTHPFVKPDYSSIKHPSTIKLISVVKAPVPVSVDDGSVGLTKGELLMFINDPFWWRVRVTLMVLFALAFVGMLIGAAVIIATSPACIPVQSNVTEIMSNFTSNANV